MDAGDPAPHPQRRPGAEARRTEAEGLVAERRPLGVELADGLEVRTQPREGRGRIALTAEVAEKQLAAQPVELVVGEHAPRQEGVPEEVPRHEALAQRHQAAPGQRIEDGRQRRRARDAGAHVRDEALQHRRQLGALVVGLAVHVDRTLPGGGEGPGAVALGPPGPRLRCGRAPRAVDAEGTQLAAHVEDVEADTGRRVGPQAVAGVGELAEAVREVALRAAVEVLVERLRGERGRAFDEAPAGDLLRRRQQRRGLGGLVARRPASPAAGEHRQREQRRSAPPAHPQALAKLSCSCAATSPSRTARPKGQASSQWPAQARHGAAVAVDGSRP